jgi:DNA polymerase-3 subunit gamma/tau
VFELDAASNNSVDDIRSLIDQVRIPPQTGKYKVYIIDEVHMLSSAAFNAFFENIRRATKTKYFYFGNDRKHKIIPTILSRCQIFDFKRITVKTPKNILQKWLLIKEFYEDDALILSLRKDGAMRDALSILTEVSCGTNLTRQAVTENLNVLDYETYITVTDLILENKIPELLVSFNEILAKGFDSHHFVSGLASHFRDLLVQNSFDIILFGSWGTGSKNVRFTSPKCSQDFLLKGITIANDCDLKFKLVKISDSLNFV